MTTENTATEALALQRKAELEKQNEWVKSLANFDWKNIPPHQMAMVLTKKPYRGKAQEPDYYLTVPQALVFAMRCFELGLSPLSSEVWFDRDRWSTNVTLEGKIRLARERGITGAPTFKEEKRPWKVGAIKISGYTDEPGITATIKAGDSDCSYTVWLSEWYVGTSPVWKAKPEHMMRVRAYDKVLAFAAGVGVSDMPSENEIGDAVLPEQVSKAAVQPSRPAPGAIVERMPYAQPGWKPPIIDERGGDHMDDTEQKLAASIRQVQDRK